MPSRAGLQEVTVLLWCRSSMQEAGEPMAAEETAAHHEDFPGETLDLHI